MREEQHTFFFSVIMRLPAACEVLARVESDDIDFFSQLYALLPHQQVLESLDSLSFG
jgi:hypothetical protein